MDTLRSLGRIPDISNLNAMIFRLNDSEQSFGVSLT